MKRQNVLVLLSIGALAGAPLALQQSAPAHAGTSVQKGDEVSGKIGSVSAEGHTFVLQVGDEERTVRIDGDTLFTLDGKPSTAKEALAAGRKARVEIVDGKATRVAVRT